MADVDTQAVLDSIEAFADQLQDVQDRLIAMNTAQLDGRLVHKRCLYTFNAATGTVAAHTVFAINPGGRVFVDLITAFCTSTLTSGGTPAITLGTPSAVTGFLTAPTGGAPGIVTNDWWLTAVTPQLVGGPVSVVTGGTVVSSRFKVLAENIILDIPTAAVTGGSLVFDVFYLPITDNATLTPVVT